MIMHVIDKLFMEKEDLIRNGPITIVAFGDSITHGAVGFGEIDYDTVYWNLLRKKLHSVRNFVPINVINAGIGGITAGDSVERMDKQVLSHTPDLVIVCFGLNDVNDPLERYLNALRTIFQKCIQANIDVIFMTPNMLNTYVAEGTTEKYVAYAETTAIYQNEGRMDMYMEKARSLAEEMGITICDCYSEWKQLSKETDTTMLLANWINHPVREMHELFADRLFRIIVGDVICET